MPTHQTISWIPNLLVQKRFLMYPSFLYSLKRMTRRYFMTEIVVITTCVRINRRDIGRSATLQRPSVGLGNRRRKGLEGRGTRPDSRPDHCLPLGVVGWPPRSREMRRTVCSVEPIFWPMRGMGCAPRVLACCAPEPHPDAGISTRGQGTPAATAPRPARPFRDRLNSQFFAARHHTRAFPVQSGLREV